MFQMTVEDLAYAYNGIHQRQWQVLKRLVRSELLVTYSNAYGRAIGNPDQGWIYRVHLEEIRKSESTVPMPKSARLAYPALHLIASEALTACLGLPPLHCLDPIANQASLLMLGITITDSNAMFIVERAVDFAISSYQWSDAALAIESLYDGDTTIVLPPEPDVSDLFPTLWNHWGNDD